VKIFKFRRGRRILRRWEAVRSNAHKRHTTKERKGKGFIKIDAADKSLED